MDNELYNLIEELSIEQNDSQHSEKCINDR